MVVLTFSPCANGGLDVVSRQAVPGWNRRWNICTFLMLNKSDLPGGEAAALAVARAVAVLAPTLPCHTGSLAAGESRLLA